MACLRIPLSSPGPSEPFNALDCPNLKHTRHGKQKGTKTQDNEDDTACSSNALWCAWHRVVQKEQTEKPGAAEDE
jgi:hypothetical protein